MCQERDGRMMTFLWMDGLVSEWKGRGYREYGAASGVLGLNRKTGFMAAGTLAGRH